MLGDRWGVTDAEVARRYPCDDLVHAPVLQAWRGVTVHVAPARVWPWLTQIRLAPYSYDWIDNLGRRSPRQLRALPDPAPGESFTATAGRPVGRVLSVMPGEHLTGEIFGAVMSYVLVPQLPVPQLPVPQLPVPQLPVPQLPVPQLPVPQADATRLLLKIVMARRRWLAPAVSMGDLVMARRQLLTLKELAEG